MKHKTKKVDEDASPGNRFRWVKNRMVQDRHITKRALRELIDQEPVSALKQLRD